MCALVLSTNRPGLLSPSPSARKVELRKLTWGEEGGGVVGWGRRQSVKVTGKVRQEDIWYMMGYV